MAVVIHLNNFLGPVDDTVTVLSQSPSHQARDASNKNAASAYGKGAGGLAIDAMVIGCLGVDRRGRRFLVLSHFVQGDAWGASCLGLRT